MQHFMHSRLFDYEAYIKHPNTDRIVADRLENKVLERYDAFLYFEYQQSIETCDLQRGETTVSRKDK